MAKTGGYKGKLLEEVKSLSEGRVKAVADFAAYLKEREEWEATGEILGDEELAQQVKESRKAWAEDRKGEFVSLEEMKAKLNVLRCSEPECLQNTGKSHPNHETSRHRCFGKTQVQAPQWKETPG